MNVFDTLAKVKSLKKLFNKTLDKICVELKNKHNIPIIENKNAGFLALVESEEWPSTDILLCETLTDKLKRANYIYEEMFHDFVANKKVLDFGCGDGLVAKRIAMDNPFLVVGYDFNVGIEVGDNLLLTTNLDEVADNGPYDIILLHDVLDHAVNPIETLSLLHVFCKEDTVIYVRCHPWCSRHGGHIFKNVNKAFSHLFLTEEELASITDEKPPFTQAFVYPVQVYEEWFEKSGFEIVQKISKKQPVEPFFATNIRVRQKLLSMWGRGIGDEFPNPELEINFIDYTIKQKL